MYILDFSILEFLKFIFLGLVQGITEVLPVSSSGHVQLLKSLIGLEMEENVVFLILLNTGSLATFVIIYFKRLWILVKAFVNYIFKPSKRQENQENAIHLTKILVASIPAGVAGLFFKPIIENNLAEYAILISGLGLLFTATVIYAISTLNFRQGVTKITWVDSILIGLAQAVAIVPGISRSGMTTSMALKRDNSINTALDFSFLMYIFISLAATGLLIRDLFVTEVVISSVQYVYFTFSCLAAMVTTFIAYKMIFNIFKSGKLRYFSYYCFAVGILAVILYVI